MSNDTVITVVGNLTADPEVKFFDSGARVANFTIASTPRQFDKATGQWKDGDALFLRCNLWNDYAEHATDSLAKGMQVIATGRLRQRSYQTREGENRTSVELDVDEIGPSLRFATATVTKATRSNQPQGAGQVQRTTAPAQADPWATGNSGWAPEDQPPF